MSVRERKGFSNVLEWRVAINSPFSGLSANAKHVALSLANYMSAAGDQAYPSPETLHEDATRAESTVRSALVELQRGGWIVKVRQGGGRGRTNEWASTIPDTFWATIEQILGRETRRDMAGFRAARELLRERRRAAKEAAKATSTETSIEESANAETRRAPAPFRDGKPAGGASETRRESAKNPPVPGPEVEDLEGDHEAAAGAVVVDAAAAALDRDLRRHHVAADVRGLALLDVERARAWVELAAREARENAGGFIAAGIRSAEWPSVRGAEVSAERKHEARVASLRRFVDGGMAAEAHELVDDWSTLTQVERNEYHLLVDDLVSEQLPEAPSIDDEEAAA